MYKELGVTKKFELRWCLKYSDGTSRHGAWLKHHEKDASTRASMQPTENLLLATIQARAVGTQSVTELLAVPVNRFKRFEWVAGLPYQISASPVSSGGAIIGLKIVTNDDKKMLVYIDGRVEKGE
jgi:hypothetical protein